MTTTQYIDNQLTIAADVMSNAMDKIAIDPFQASELGYVTDYQTNKEYREWIESLRVNDSFNSFRIVGLLSGTLFHILHAPYNNNVHFRIVGKMKLKFLLKICEIEGINNDVVQFVHGISK